MTSRSKQGYAVQVQTILSTKSKDTNDKHIDVFFCTRYPYKSCLNMSTTGKKQKRSEPTTAIEQKAKCSSEECKTLRKSISEALGVAHGILSKVNFLKLFRGDVGTAFAIVGSAVAKPKQPFLNSMRN